MGSPFRIVVAPDSFKGTLSAAEAAGAIRDGWWSSRPADRVDLCPIADGGEGTLDALVSATGGRIVTQQVTGPTGRLITARWGWLGDTRTALIEMAEASGLHLVSSTERNPNRTTTFGTGELMHAAIPAGAEELLIAIGGSATSDAGAGMAQALGLLFRRHDGTAITEPMSGGRLREVAAVEGHIDAPPVRVLCDVTNPLYGARGAAHIFAPQKGATPEQVVELDDAMVKFVRLLGERATRIADEPGAGAAGGLGFGLRFWCHAALERGVDVVLDAVRFDDRIQNADLVITGEGRLDRSSFDGKACVSVAHRSARFDIPVIALVGNVALDLSEGESTGAFALVETTNGAGISRRDAIAELTMAAQRAASRWSQRGGEQHEPMSSN